MIAPLIRWASWKPSKPEGAQEPAPPGRYARTLRERYLSVLQDAARRYGTHLAFAATNPYPLNVGGPHYASRRSKPYDMAACNPTARERRYPHVLREYNRLARQACAALSIPYLDLWEIALPLFDISGDGAHYAVDATPVGRAQAVRLLHWLSSLTCMQVLTTAP